MLKSGKRYMKTYDYYKDKATEKNFSYWFVNNNGHIRVELDEQLCARYGRPFILNKGVWCEIFKNVYVPEGDPEFDETKNKLVWGKSVILNKYGY